MAKVPVRVLLVEDNPAQAYLLQRHFLEAELGRFSLVHADRLSVAFEHVAQRSMDVALLDLSLPESRGLDTLRAFIAQAPNIPVVVLTGHDDEDLAIRAVQKGAQDYLIKGKVDVRLIARSIRYALERHGLRTALEWTVAEAHASEARFQSIFQGAGIGIAIARIQGGILVNTNQALQEMLGYEAEELDGKPLFELTPPDEVEHTRDAIRKLYGNPSQRVQIDKRYLKKNGDLIWGRVTFTLIPDAEGEPELIVGMIEDVTERKQADIALHRQKLLLERAEELARVGHWNMTLPDQQAEWSDEMFRIYGMRRGESGALMEEAIKRCHPDDRERVVSTIARMMQEGGSFSSESRIVRPDGDIRYVKARGECATNEEGVVTWTFGVVKDVTEQKQIELDLRESRERYRSLIDHAPDAIFVFDVDTGCFVDGNSQAERLFGFSRDEFLQANPATLSPERQPDGQLSAEAIRRQIQHVLQGQPFSFEWTFCGVKGEIFTAEVRLVCLPATDRKLIRASVVDISERKRIQQELEQARDRAEAGARAKSEFLATMSHEIRTPLNGIIGMTSLLAGLPLNEEQRDYVETIRTSGDTLLTIVNDVLDFAKVDAGKIDLEMYPFEVRSCVAEAVDLLALPAAQKGITLDYFVDPNVPRFVLGDVTRIRQVLVNLLSNAVKFTHEGEVVVTLDAQLLSGDQCLLHFAVRDTGIGIGADQLDTIFYSFTQADASTTRKYGGTGLGLAISERLVECLGGEIWVESREGVGSTFHIAFEMPTVPNQDRDAGNDTPAPPPAGSSADEPEASPAETSALRVLLAEDNQVNQKVALRLLQRLNYTADVVANGREALEAVAQGQYDVILMDVQMPEMDGLEATRRLCVQYAAPARPYIIALTANAMAGDRERCLTAGMDDYLSKPVRLDILREALSRAGQVRTALAATPPAEKQDSKASVVNKQKSVDYFLRSRRVS